jgi:hypothetical protein
MNFTSLILVMFWDPGSGILDLGFGKKIIPDPWGKKAPDPGSVSATLNKGLFKSRNYTILYMTNTGL